MAVDVAPTVGRVLVVEDHRKLRELLGDILVAQGHSVRMAADGLEALRLVADELPDVIVLDLMLPKLSGLEVCRKLKSELETAAVPILLITALTERRDRLSAIEAGANDFLVKPIDMQDVCLRVRNAISTKRLYDRLQENYETVRALEQLRDNLTHMLVHDLRAPLSGVYSNLQLIATSAMPRLNDVEKECLQGALDSTHRLTSMIASVLEVARLESKTVPLQPRDADLVELVRTALMALALQSSPSIHFDPPQDPVMLECDPALVQRVIENLVDNAVRFAGKDGETRIRLEPGASGVRLEVADTGPGVPSEFRERIFEKFGHVDATAGGHAIGLGLPFCKLAVEAHGGRIGVDSDEGRGSTFWLELPSQPVPAG